MPARLSPYSGSRQITSKSAEPTSSYRYFEGNSFCPGCESPSATSEAEFRYRGSFARCAATFAVQLPWLNPPRSGRWRTRKDSAAGTSCGTSGGACRHRCAATRPSSRNACRRKNSRSSRDKTENGLKPGSGANGVEVHSHPLPSRSITPKALAPAGCASTAVGSHRA